MTPNVDINVILADLPTTITAYTVANVDLTYTVVLNSRMCYERQLEAYKHELGHIQRGDYDKKCDADLIEIFAHCN